MIASLIAIFIENLPYLVKAAKTAPEIFAYIQRTKKTLEQSKEWTPEQQAEFDRQVEEITSQPHWRPE